MPMTKGRGSSAVLARLGFTPRRHRRDFCPPRLACLAVLRARAFPRNALRCCSSEQSGQMIDCLLACLLWSVRTRRYLGVVGAKSW
uniref:Uncharacterized protein n=1 Tax=Oryza sativa subsp. japonica TaxID=39947 RepID=Q6ZF00_ORYSJ|nr:hypothetical protein [Oryza sativa Japonica Group]